MMNTTAFIVFLAPQVVLFTAWIWTVERWHALAKKKDAVIAELARENAELKMRLR